MVLDWGMKYSKCPYCGKECYGYTDEEVLKRYKEHVCMHTRTEQEITAILDKIINENN